MPQARECSAPGPRPRCRRRLWTTERHCRIVAMIVPPHCHDCRRPRPGCRTTGGQMIRTDRARIRPTRGERLRILALVLAALVGAVLCLASVGALDPGRAGPAGPGPALWRLMAGALGTFVALRFNLGRFGWPRLRGWARMAGGVLLVTLFAP